ncbi:hypothetical protein, partial [Xanthomonas oryzae]|uniref:hypothetical protein n=1 Tax=Xanthomonas oryzae TaxID=347 RepID=UPI003CCFEFD5
MAGGPGGVSVRNVAIICRYRAGRVDPHQCVPEQVHHTVHPRPRGGDLQSSAIRSLQKSDVSQPSVQTSETPAQ